MGTDLKPESGVNLILTLRTEGWEAHKGKRGSIRRHTEGWFQGTHSQELSTHAAHPRILSGSGDITAPSPTVKDWPKS